MTATTVQVLISSVTVAGLIVVMRYAPGYFLELLRPLIDEAKERFWLIKIMKGDWYE